MVVSRIQQGAIAVLIVKGPVVDEELPALIAKLDECISSASFKIVLDLEDVPFIDSAGLERLQRTASDLGRHGGDIRMASLNDVCRDIFLATRMESFIQVFDNRDAAVRSLL